MKTVAAVLAVLALVLAPVAARAETVYDLATDGVTMSVSGYACPGGTCTPCVGGSPIYGPVISFGETGFNGRDAWGTVSGSFSARAVIDGVSLAGGLLPAGSYFRSYLAFRHSFCRGFAGNDDCPGYRCGVSYQVGSVSGAVGRTNGVSIPIDVPAEEAANGTFQFSFCNHHLTWGAGCNVPGSIDLRWRVVTPAPVRAMAAGAGDAAPLAFPGTGVTVDKASGPAGVVTATRVTGAPPVPPALLPLSPGHADYWEIRTDMPQGGFAAQLQIAYDPARLVGGVDEQQLRIWRFDLAGQEWEMLPTVLDATAHTATTTGLDRFSLFCLGDMHKAVPARGRSWGSLKTIYR